MEQPKIIVAIRKRPLSKKEEGKGDTDIITVKNRQTLIVSQYKQKVDLSKYLEETLFNFDFAFDEYTSNQEIYQSAVRPLVQSAFQGAKVTCFAYGQTGSGKTHTMNGQINQGIPGLYTLGAQDIFSYLEDSRYSHLTVRLSFFEIYCGKLFDLLNKRQQLKIREDNKSNINIIGLEEANITSWEQFIELLNYGSTQRVTSQNSANADSSRSHAILQITLKQGKKIFGKISFIDLAGNQRGADHMDMNKQTRIDGAEINKSLLSLKQCIRALDQGKGHTPFRGSKLTMVLKDSFVGFCRTLMIGNISPSSASSENTLNTLRYADRVKQLRKPQETNNKQELRAKELMLPRQNKNAIKIDISKDDDFDDINKKRLDAQKNFGIIPKQQELYQQKIPDNAHTRRQSNKNGLNFANVSKINSNSIPITNLNKNSLFQNQASSNTIKNPIASYNFTKINNINSKKVPIFNQNDRNPQIPTSLHYGFSEENTAPTVHHLARVNSYQLPNDRLYEFNIGKNNNNKMDIQNGPSTKAVNYGKLNNNSNLHFVNQRQFPISNNSSQYSYTSMTDQIPLANNKHQQIIQCSSYEAQQHEIASSWEQSIQMFNNTDNPRVMVRLQQSISKKLLAEESVLLQNHSNTLRKEIDIIKKEMSIITELQANIHTISAREYVSLLEENIQEKLSQLEMLRQNLAQFTYKFDQLEQIEERTNKVVGVHWEDQQLLDDLS